jgi:tRNA threonylcarbamoyladenosine modification (KEOPS) complex  Pcc1 subunit
MSLPQTVAVEASNGEAAYPAVLMNVRIASRISHVEMRRRAWRAVVTVDAVLLPGRRFARKRV